ncbi:MAG: spore germination protein [Bacillota bacterium]
MGNISFELKIGKIKVGSISNAASLNIGHNYLRKFKSMSKSNSGVGTIFGSNNSFSHSKNTVKDPDRVDMCWETKRPKSKRRHHKRSIKPARRFHKKDTGDDPRRL